jgi:hypothetical protein
MASADSLFVIKDLEVEGLQLDVGSCVRAVIDIQASKDTACQAVTLPYVLATEMKEGSGSEADK